MERYSASETRYSAMKWRRSGKSGIKLSEISLGFWHNFGDVIPFATGEKIALKAFDRGITHFDLANNYGPPVGAAERFFGELMKRHLLPYRDELCIATKAGYAMWSGPYGDFGSRKYLVSSCDASLKRMGLDYVDIFYHHRPDPDTPLEETMGALDYIVRSGRALYVGLSNYDGELTRKAQAILKGLGTPCIVNQSRYSMLDRGIEKGLLPALEEEGIGGIWYSPLAQGLLTGRYLDGKVPEGSRASLNGFLKSDRITAGLIKKLNALDSLAAARGETLSRLAIKWLLRDGRTTSVLLGASSPAQLEENLLALEGAGISDTELALISDILSKPE